MDVDRLRLPRSSMTRLGIEAQVVNENKKRQSQPFLVDEARYF